MKLAFFTTTITLRGTCVALYEYACYARELWDADVSIVTTDSFDETNWVRERDPVAPAWYAMRRQFPLEVFGSLDLAEQWMETQGVNWIYTIQHGEFKSRIAFQRIPYSVHCVFQMETNRDVSVSHALARKFGQNPETHCVPHMISIAPDGCMRDLRHVLGISGTQRVFGRYGGWDTWNLSWANRTISQYVRAHEDVVFLFANTPQWDTHERIIHLPAIANEEWKRWFIRTCTAMLVAETLGHTFGLAIGEFQAFQKPILVYNGNVWNRAHLDILEQYACGFSTPDELMDQLNAISLETTSQNTYARYTPTAVMSTFAQVFSLPILPK